MIKNGKKITDRDLSKGLVHPMLKTIRICLKCSMCEWYEVCQIAHSFPGYCCILLIDFEKLYSKT